MNKFYRWELCMQQELEITAFISLVGFLLVEPRKVYNFSVNLEPYVSTYSFRKALLAFIKRPGLPSQEIE